MMLQSHYQGDWTGGVGREAFGGMDHKTTNLGVRSSNLFGRAKSSTKIETSLYYRNPPCRMRKSAWHLHGKERGLLVSTRASDAGRFCDYASGLLQRSCLQRRRWHPTSALACCRVCKPRIDGSYPATGKFAARIRRRPIKILRLYDKEPRQGGS